MQQLTAPPRDGLTAEQVEQLLTGSSALTVGAGLERLDSALNLIEDLADEPESGTVSRVMAARVHGTCQLRLSTELEWGTALVRPYVILSADGVSARFDLGVFSLSTPARVLGESVLSWDVDGYDRLYLLDRPVGDTYAVPAGALVLDAVADAIAAAGLGGVALDPTAITAALPDAMVWPFLDGGGGESTTWLRVVNDLLGTVGYRGLYADPASGVFRSEPYANPAGRSPEFTFSADGERSVVSDDRTETQDLWSVPNRWVFVQSNRDAAAAPPTEGDGIYTVINQSEGPSSVDGRGLVWTSVLQLDAADQATLIAQGDIRVAADKRTSRVLEFQTSPFPAAGHYDVLTYDDPELGGAVKVQVMSWTVDLLGANTRWTAEAVV